MSGGSFDYEERRILNIIDVINDAITNPDRFGFDDEERVIEKMKGIVDECENLYHRLQVLDYFLESDYSEKDFFEMIDSLPNHPEDRFFVPFP